MSTVVKDLGAVSAYAYAVEKGYTGTEAEFAELMASYAEVGQTATDAAESALNSKTAAQTSAQTASSKASEASQSASQASGYAQTAETAKTDAQTAKTQADTARDEAVTAKTAAETAQGKAEDAQAAAESVAESIPSDYSQLSEDVSDLKEGLNDRTTFADQVFEAGSLDYSPVYTNNTMNSVTGERGDASPKRASTPEMYFIPVGCNIYVKTYDYTVYTCNVYCYSESKEFLGRLSAQVIFALSNIPVVSGTKYVRFFVFRKDDGNLMPQDAASAITFECVYNGRVSVLDNELTALQEKTDKIAVNNNLLHGFKLNDGYYDTVQHSYDLYKYFAKVPVTNGKTYIAYPRARMIYIYAANGTLINYLNQQNITQITAEGDGFAYVTYYAADNLDSALFYEEGAKNVYPKDSLALSDNIIQTDMLTGKKWVVLGDSFTAGADSGTIQGGAYAGQKIVYPYLIGNRTGLNVVPFFAGGRTLAYPSVPGDFINSVTCPGQPYYYQNIPSDVDYVTIYLGINDHHHLTGGGDSEDPTGLIDLGTITDNITATYYGAWNVVIGWLIANRPNAHIGIIVSNGITSTPSQESAHPTAEQSLWRKAQIDIAEKYGIPYIDLNGDARTRAMIRTSNPNIPDTIKQKMIENWAVDYVGGNYHPNNAAHEFESYIIEAFLRTI